MIRAIAAAALLAAPQVAAAQGTCLTRQEVSDLAVFFMPSLIDSAAAKCSASLPANAFLRTNGRNLSGRLRAEGGDHSAAALAAFDKIGDQKLPSGVSRETMAKLVEEVVGGMVTESIKPKDCAQIDALTAALSPLPAENLGAAIGLMFELTGDDTSGKAKAPFRMCRAAAQ